MSDLDILLSIFIAFTIHHSSIFSLNTLKSDFFTISVISFIFNQNLISGLSDPYKSIASLYVISCISGVSKFLLGYIFFTIDNKRSDIIFLISSSLVNDNSISI